MVYNWFSAGLFPSVITFALAFLVLFIGSITDLKTREVPDWVNYGLMTSGVALNLAFTVIYSNFYFILSSLIGLAVFFGIAWVMFYSGQWGGGDSKMLIGLGAAIGIDYRMGSEQFLLGFFLNLLFVGAIYGIFWSLSLAVKKSKAFSKEFRKQLNEKSAVKSKKLVLLAIALLIALAFIIKDTNIKVVSLMTALLCGTGFYLIIFIRSVEKSSMIKLVEPSKLTEGDWIVKNVYVDKKYVCGPKDLGISIGQINKLRAYFRKGKIRNVLVKEGIPFVPSFFIAYVATFIIGNPLRFF
ncbi:MAG TPA: A24 family peptidase [Candidatus Nanoarchaeia archaeon]|nr:A24 family peptidase [Candidatus Nanoarchaeia archaeon]